MSDQRVPRDVRRRLSYRALTRPTPVARIRELSLDDGNEDLQRFDSWSYSWDHGYETLIADRFEYRGVFHPGDGCCHGNPCRYCGRAVIE